MLRKLVEYVVWVTSAGTMVATALIGALWYFQRSLIFPRPRTALKIKYGDKVVVDVSKEVRPHGVGERVVGVYFPASQSSNWTLVFFHGNADQIGNVGDILGRELSSRLGVGFLAVEYPGYALAGAGEPTQKSMVWAAERSVKHLTEKMGVREDRICAFGQSIGTAVAAELAARNLATKLVMLSPFTSIPDMCKALFPFVPRPQFFISDPFDTFALASHFKNGNANIPILILHGVNDEIVPFDHSQRLKAILPHATFVPLPNCGHNDTFSGNSYHLFYDHLRSFLASSS